MNQNRLHLVFYRCAVWRDIVSLLPEGWSVEDVSDLRGESVSHDGMKGDVPIVVLTSFSDDVYWEHWMNKHPKVAVFQIMSTASGFPVKTMADFITLDGLGESLPMRLLVGQQRHLEQFEASLSSQKMLKDRKIQMELNDRLLKVSIELKEAKERIEELSMTDSLTQVKNRRFFDFQLARDLLQASRYKTDLSLFIMDIDNFKTINDTFGHLVGDEVLIHLGELIRNCMRDTDWAARYGGEEFVVVLPMTNMEGALKTAERLRAKVEAELSHIEDRTFTVSVGVAHFAESSTASEIVRLADESLYKAKKTGKNKVVYFNEKTKECCEFSSGATQ